MKLLNCLMIGVASTMLFSCVSSKKYKAEQARALELTNAQSKLQGDLKSCEDLNAENARKRSQLESEIDNLNKQIAYLKDNNTNVLNQLKDLSVLSATQAESVKKSLENIGSKDAYIQNLQSEMARKDSLNMALVMNLKGALNDVNDKDVEIQVEKGVVFISIADKLLFKTGYKLNAYTGVPTDSLFSVLFLALSILAILLIAVACPPFLLREYRNCGCCHQAQVFLKR